jgi:hypothetical protein
MTVKDKKHLLDLLTETHSAIRTTVTGIDPEMRVYTDTDWRNVFACISGRNRILYPRSG